MERLVGGIIIPDVRDAISRARRTPKACLYCPNAPDSNEHVLADALGGRLTAPILCSEHNGLAGRKCDGPMAVQLAPFATWLGIKRSSGRRVTFRGHSDAGEPLVIDASGNVRRHKRLEVVKVAQDGKIRYARGELVKIDELKAVGALEDGSLHVIAVMEKPPSINFEVAIARDVEQGVFKTALHFIAGFVSDIPSSMAHQLLPYIEGAKAAGGEFVRSMPLSGRYFPESWPPRHEIRTYPEGGETFVTVLLFGLFGFQVRVPVQTHTPMRYFQPLVDAVDPVLEPNLHTRDFDWSEHLTHDDWDALEVNMQWRKEKFLGLAGYRQALDRCRSAGLRIPNWFGKANFVDAYRFELQRGGFTADEITRLMWIGQKARARGRFPWLFTLDEFIG